jgi:hypothetical protein
MAKTLTNFLTVKPGEKIVLKLDPNGDMMLPKSHPLVVIDEDGNELKFHSLAELDHFQNNTGKEVKIMGDGKAYALGKDSNTPGLFKSAKLMGIASYEHHAPVVKLYGYPISQYKKAALLAWVNDPQKKGMVIGPVYALLGEWISVHGGTVGADFPNGDETQMPTFSIDGNTTDGTLGVPPHVSNPLAKVVAAGSGECTLTMPDGVDIYFKDEGKMWSFIKGAVANDKSLMPVKLGPKHFKLTKKYPAKPDPAKPFMGILGDEIEKQAKVIADKMAKTIDDEVLKGLGVNPDLIYVPDTGTTIIWCSDIHESSPKKPGIYSYEADVAVIIGKAQGEYYLNKAWAQIGDSDKVLLDYNEAALFKDLTFYDGTQTKPDMLVAHNVGHDAAATYKGYAYVVIEGLNLTPFGNKVPNFSFELGKKIVVEAKPEVQLAAKVEQPPEGWGKPAGGFKHTSKIGDAEFVTEYAADGTPVALSYDKPVPVVPDGQHKITSVLEALKLTPENAKKIKEAFKTTPFEQAAYVAQQYKPILKNVGTEKDPYLPSLHVHKNIQKFTWVFDVEVATLGAVFEVSADVIDNMDLLARKALLEVWPKNPIKLQQKVLSAGADAASVEGYIDIIKKYIIDNQQ